MKEMNGTKKLLVVSKKGFLSMYGLTILPLVLTIASVLLFNIKHQWNALNLNQTIHMCEIYAIQLVKDELLAYEESDKQIQYLGYDIEIQYEDITAYIKIKKDENMYLHSCLIWDDIENVVVDYTYLYN